MLIAKPPYIVEVSRLWGDINGLALYPFIFVLDKDNQTVINHEKAHIEQQLRGWIIGFYVKYIYYHFRYGYALNPYELEAYKKQ